MTTTKPYLLPNKCDFCDVCAKKTNHNRCSICYETFCYECPGPVQPFCFGKHKFVNRGFMAEAGRHYGPRVYCKDCLATEQLKHGFVCMKKRQRNGLYVSIYRKLFRKLITKEFRNGEWFVKINHPLFIDWQICATTRKELMKETVNQIFVRIHANLELLHQLHSALFKK